MTVDPRHRKISGGHRRSSVLIAGPLPGYEVAAGNVASINIAASIASFLDLPARGGEDREGVPGRSFLIKTSGGA